jgi:membrane-associated phospholipid phosphatase
MRCLHGRLLLALGFAISFALGSSARAGDADQDDHARLVQLAVTVGLGAAYLTAEFGFHRQLAPDECRWCTPDAFDASMRNALRWNDTGLANTLSNVTGYVLAPVTAVGWMMLASGEHRTRRRAYDDVTPVIQSAIVASLLQHVTKLAVARQRPYAHYAAPGTLVPSEEDNVSFFSGHTTLTFSLAVSAGTVANMRGYAFAPYIWASGLTLAATTGYLRVAADRHYVTDVLTGAAVGSLVGCVWPRLIHPHLRRDLVVVLTTTGVAATGQF